ncbi:BTB/POZ domain-containing protein 9, partial [Clarias magur]
MEITHLAQRLEKYALRPDSSKIQWPELTANGGPSLLPPTATKAEPEDTAPASTTPHYLTLK